MPSQGLSRRSLLRNCSLLLTCQGWPFQRNPPSESGFPTTFCRFERPDEKPISARNALQDLPSAQQAALCSTYLRWAKSRAYWGKTEQKKLHFYSGGNPWLIHTGSAPPFFLVWHRAFLYFHEKALAYAALNPSNPNFRLPFWNWDSPDYLLPPPFCRPAPGTDPNVNPFNSSLNWPAINGLSIPSIEELVSMPSDDFLLHLLCCHAEFHTRLGDDMTDPIGSAQDPIFYPFHANFDRLWYAYQQYGPKTGQFQLDNLGRMLFFDVRTANSESKGWVIAEPGDFADCGKLGYTYNVPQPSLTYHIDAIPGGPAPSADAVRSYISNSRPPKPGTRRQIALYDIALPESKEPVEWQLSVKGMGAPVVKKFMSHMAHDDKQHTSKTFPCLLVDVTQNVGLEDFVKKNVSLSLARNGESPINLKARIVFQIWTPK